MTTNSGSIVHLEGVLVTVNPRQFKFAPENYKVTWWDRVKTRFWNLMGRLWPVKPVIM